MKKRILGILLTMVMILACACGGSKESAADRARRGLYPSV